MLYIRTDTRPVWSRHRRAAALMLCIGMAALGTSVAHAAVSSAVPDSNASELQMTQLTDLVTQAMPMSEVIEMIKVKMPNWPFQDHPDAVTPEQLACVRAQTSADNYKALVRSDVADYVHIHPDRVTDDIILLTTAAPLLKASVMAGANQAATDTPADYRKVIDNSTPEQMLAMLSVMKDGKNTDLRKVIGFGNTHSNTSTADNQQAGRSVAADRLAPLLLKSMATCHVPMKALY